MPRPDPGPTEETRLGLDELAFPVGTRFALRFDDDPNERSVMLSLVGWLTGESVVAGGNPRVVLPPFARVGATARARLREGSLVCTFTTRLTAVTTEPHPLVQVAWPKALQLSRVRDAMRVRTGIHAHAWVDGDDVRVPCTIRDLSPKGARVVAPGRLGEPGARVDLRFALDVGEGTHAVALGGYVRHATPARINGHPAGWVHGVALTAVPLASLAAIECYLIARRAGTAPEPPAAG